MQKILNLIFFIFLISIHPTYAQIAIGVNEKPEPGALLQLKNKEGILDDSANSTKGLILPRVYLNSAFSLSPLDLDNSVNHNKYVGAVVYNVNNKCSNINWNNDKPNVFKEGIFVWDENQWTILEDISLNSKIGSVKDAEGNIYTTMDYGSAGVWMLENLRSKKYDTEATVDPTFQTLFDNTPAGFAYTTNAPRWAYPGIAGGNGTDSKYFEMDQSLGLLYNIPAVFGLKGSLHATHNIQGLALSKWMENTIIQ